MNAGLQPGRFDRLDALRGLAIVWMAAFHFAFDLNHYGLLQPRQNFYADPFWTGQRTAIVSLFVFTAGLSQAVAWQAGQGWPRFWRRWAQVAGCAVLVSIGSAFMFPRSWISFGVLHGIAVMLLVCRVAAPMPLRWLLLGGLLALLLPQFVQHPFFDSRSTQWLGLVTRKPVTEDYVPVLPWLGVMLWGLAAGRWLQAQRPGVSTGVSAGVSTGVSTGAHTGVLSGAFAGVLDGSLPAVLRPLAALGRWSLSFYMLHQPVLIGGILAWQAVRAA